jgi:SAM-dependent methyltransferase
MPTSPFARTPPARSDKHWKIFGKSNPYFGVLSDNKFKSDALTDEVLAEFFETGRLETTETLRRYQAIFGAFNPGSCLDFGCGVGRNSIHLADQFQTVTGVDVSPGMLREAECNALKYGKPNLVFREAIGDAPFDFVYSNIVLQHIHPSVGLGILKTILDRVAEGGGGMIQIVFRIPKHLEKLNRRMDALPWLWGFWNLCMGRKFSHPRMATYAYPIDDVLALFVEAGIPSCFSEFTNHSDHIGVKIFFRKPG